MSLAVAVRDADKRSQLAVLRGSHPGSSVHESRSSADGPVPPKPWRCFRQHQSEDQHLAGLLLRLNIVSCVTELDIHLLTDAIRLSLHLGLPPPIDSDLDFGSIHSFLRRQTAPPTFAMQVRVQLIVAKFTSLLNHDMGEGASASFIRLLDTELDALRAEVSLEDEQMRAVELGILGAKMHLYALVITKDSNNSSSRQIMLRTARDVALRIIHISTLAMRNTPPDGKDQELIRRQRCLPKNHYRCLAFATIFLLKFFHRRGSDAPEEKQAVANHISMAQNLFKACATEPRDEYNRTAGVFEVLGRESPRSIEPSALRLTHRMGVSIVFDAVSHASEARGKPVEMGENETIQDEGGAVGAKVHEQLSGQPVELDPSDTNSEFLRGFWSDPYTSLLSFDPTPLESEYQNSWPSF